MDVYSGTIYLKKLKPRSFLYLCHAYYKELLQS